MEITNIYELQKHDKVDIIFRSSLLVVKGVKVISIYDDAFGPCCYLDGYLPVFTFNTYLSDILKKVIITPYGCGLVYKRILFGFVSEDF